MPDKSADVDIATHVLCLHQSVAWRCSTATEMFTVLLHKNNLFNSIDLIYFHLSKKMTGVYVTSLEERQKEETFVDSFLLLQIFPWFFCLTVFWYWALRLTIMVSQECVGSRTPVDCLVLYNWFRTDHEVSSIGYLCRKVLFKKYNELA